MLSPKVTATVLAALTLVVGSACKQGGATAEPVTRNDQIPLRITVTMRGDLAISIKTRTVKTQMALLRNAGEDIQDFFAIQPVEAITEGGNGVRPGVALSPFRGKGSYTVKKGAPQDDVTVKDGQQTAKVSSAVGVEWWPAGGEPMEYKRRAKPCTVEIDDDDGTKGRLRCPDITHEAPGGKHFSLEMRWEKA